MLVCMLIFNFENKRVSEYTLEIMLIQTFCMGF